MDVAGVRRQTFWTELLKERVVDEAVALDEQNRDDAAIGNTGVMLPLPCIFHSQFENLVEEIASPLFSIALSCHHNIIQSLHSVFLICI